MIALVHLWIGDIPEYFKYHYRSLEYQNNIDFYFVTNQDLDLELKYEHFHYVKMTEEEIHKRVISEYGVDINISKDNRKFNGLKLSFPHIFKDVIDYSKYDYIGYYDIDTIFGDIYTHIEPYLRHYDFISIGAEKMYNRLSGPFTIYKNNEEMINLYRDETWLNAIQQQEPYDYEERDLDEKSHNYKTKIITDKSNVEIGNIKIRFETIWKGGKLYLDNKEIIMNHFYRKDHSKHSIIGNDIISEYKKCYMDDFIWVTYFDKNYEDISMFLIESMKKFSNRKCILYTVNYSIDKYLGDQFINRRIDLETNSKFDSIMNKPKVLLDSLKIDKPKVFIDADCILSVNCDNIKDYLPELDNYPLINSHIHDTIWLNYGEEKINTLDVLCDLEDIKQTIFPKRKTNIIIYDEKSEWFFKEQMIIYNKHKNKNIKGLFGFHEEDTSNFLLCKYDLTKSLPVLDSEHDLSNYNEKFYEYKGHPFHISEVTSDLPDDNKMICYHGFKDNEKIEENLKLYNSTVLSYDDIVISYNDNSNRIFFNKNSDLSDKNISNDVTFIIKNLINEEIVSKLENQRINDFYMFYISEIILPDVVNIEIIDNKNDRIIFRQIVRLYEFNWTGVTTHLSNLIRYEIFSKTLFNNVSFKDMVVVDIGASVGPFTKSILNEKPKEVYCLEPSKILFKSLSDNINQQNVTLINKAIHQDNGYFNIETDVYANDGKVETTNFKTFVEDNNLDHIDFIKTDCEGGEYYLFTEENMDYLTKNVDYIVGEFHLGDSSLTEKFKHFRDTYIDRFNYKIIDISGNTDITWELFSENFLNYYTEVIVFLDNKKQLK